MCPTDHDLKEMFEKVKVAKPQLNQESISIGFKFNDGIIK